jgi:hypothetical protein
MIPSWGLTIVLWVVLIVSGLNFTAQLKQQVGDLMIKGEQILSRITGNNEADVDRCDSKIQEWEEHVHKALKGTEFTQIYESTTGFTKPESESIGDLVQQTLAIDRNYMALRLTNLKKIRDSL